MVCQANFASRAWHTLGRPDLGHGAHGYEDEGLDGEAPPHTIYQGHG